MMQNFTDEIAWLKGQLGKNPSSVLFARLADRYLQLEEVDRAVEICRKGLSEHPDYATGHFILAKCYLAKKLYDEAEKQLKKAVSIDAKFLRAYKSYSDLMAEVGWTSSVQANLKKILEIDPLDMRIRQSLEMLNTQDDVEFTEDTLLDEQVDDLQTEPTGEPEEHPEPLEKPQDAQATEPANQYKVPSRKPDIDHAETSDQEKDLNLQDFEDEEAEFSEILDDIFSPGLDERGPEIDRVKDVQIEQDVDDSDVEEKTGRKDEKSFFGGDHDAETGPENGPRIHDTLDDESGPEEEHHTQERMVPDFESDEDLEIADTLSDEFGPQEKNEQDTFGPGAGLEEKSQTEDSFGPEFEPDFDIDPELTFDDTPETEKPGPELKDPAESGPDETETGPPGPAQRQPVSKQGPALDIGPDIDDDEKAELDEAGLDIEEADSAADDSSPEDFLIFEDEVEKDLGEELETEEDLEEDFGEFLASIDGGEDDITPVETETSAKDETEQHEPVQPEEQPKDEGMDVEEDEESDEPKKKFVTPTLGEIYAAQGQYAKAISVFEILQKKHPDNEWYSSKLEYLRKRLQEEEE